MKLPRDVSADRVVQVLERLGYVVIRQKGSHVRLKHHGLPVHAITVSDARFAEDRYAARNSFGGWANEIYVVGCAD
jgi:predicted RNA binding protein YcfA (HicA-like mRNA interferase family)